MSRFLILALVILVLGAPLAGCGGDAPAEGGGGEKATRGGPPGGGSSGGGSPGGGPPGGGVPQTAVPVEVAAVVRRPISSFLETNGVFEAEQDVELVARGSGPIVELLVEEGMKVEKGQLLARVDPQELRARVEIARVGRHEAEIAFNRAQTLFESELLSSEDYEEAKARFESTAAQLEGEQIVYGYTEIRAPFEGLISARFIKLAQNVNVGDRLFRITDFDPLLCPIQVPERELRRLAVGQHAFVTVEAWPGERFTAKVLRISPIVDATSGTVRVTLEVTTKGHLRPGMFASVFLETERRDSALVIPRLALSLDSVGDTVYVAKDGTAERREVKLGFEEGDFIEVRDGLAAGEDVIVIGQDGLANGTPIQVMQRSGEAAG